jgi:hypothetical protein
MWKVRFTTIVIIETAGLNSEHAEAGKPAISRYYSTLDD